MNSPLRAFVFALVCLALCLSAAAGSGCVAVSGGAIELAWTVRTEDARPADCGSQNIAQVALYVEACNDGGFEDCTSDAPVGPVTTFECDRGRGTTDFSIGPGRKKIWIGVFCQDGTTPPGVTYPEPILRDVAKGEVTELNALLISVPSTSLACSASGGA